MAGVKRSAAVMAEDSTMNESSQFLSIFDGFKAELDEHHDRRERIIKAGRDVTAGSKKIIFALQRTKHIGVPITDKKTLNDVAQLKSQIANTLSSIVPDLQQVNTYRYQRNITGGIQEWMEAVMFEHYLREQSLITYEQAQKSLPDGISLTYEDYVLGLFDMTGELMKTSITYMATNGKLPGISGGSSVLTDMQIIRNQLELLDAGASYALNRDFDSKLKVTKQSVEKVEASVYSMTVRGKERPPGWKPDEMSRQAEHVESY